MFGDVTCLCLMARSPWAQQIIVVDLGVVHVEKCSGGSEKPMMNGLLDGEMQRRLSPWAPSTLIPRAPQP